MTVPAIIYPVRDGEHNPELAYSLRSLANLPHGPVFVVGYKPTWVRGVEYIPGGNASQWPRANLYNNLRLACAHPGVPDELVIMNDDMYITAPVDSVPVLWRTPTMEASLKELVRRVGARGWWQDSLQTTLRALRDVGVAEPGCYEIHTPFPCDRDLMAQTLARFAHLTPHNPPQWRTLYGVLHHRDPKLHIDPKMLRPGPLHHPFHSTEDHSFKYFRSRLNEMFPQPSPYETEPVVARHPVTVRPRPARGARAR